MRRCLLRVGLGGQGEAALRGGLSVHRVVQEDRRGLGVVGNNRFGVDGRARVQGDVEEV